MYYSLCRPDTPRPDIATLSVIHPAWSHLEEVARGIFNGEVSEDCDVDGRIIPLPRVWHYEFQSLRLWIIQLPPHLPLGYVLHELGDEAA